MKIGAIVLAIGIVAFGLGLSIGSIDGIYESKFVIFSVIVLIVAGCCLWVSGIASLLKSIRDTNEIIYIKEKRITYRKPIDGRIIKFLITWIVSVFFCLIFLYGTGYLLGNNDQGFYQFAVPWLVFVAFLFAISTSLRK